MPKPPGPPGPSDPPDLRQAGRPDDDTARLEELFRAHAPRLFAYARRHAPADAADDVVSETFLVAWRRRSELPDEPLPWLLVVARNLLANQRRAGARADRLWLATVRSQWHLHAAAPAEDAVVERDRYVDALESCTRPEREALLLVAWDGLSVADAAAVAGCSPRAFTVRLSRARARMRARLDSDGAALVMQTGGTVTQGGPSVAGVPPRPGPATETPRLSIAQELS
ncbi:RNA polymerase sigma factor [Intrasporangium mesophilum]